MESGLQLFETMIDMYIQSTQDDEQIRFLGNIKQFYVQQYYEYAQNDALKAFDMVLDVLRWRDDQGISELLTNQESQLCDQILKQYPQGHHGESKEGLPIYIHILGQLNVRQLIEVTDDKGFMRYVLRIFERSNNLIYPRLTQKYGRLINKSIIIFDLKGFSLLQNYTKFIQWVSQVSVISSKYYPSQTQSIYIINVPTTIRFLWNTVKYQFAPEMVQHVELLDHTYLETLQQIINIENIPSYLGGDCQCKHNLNFINCA